MQRACYREVASPFVFHRKGENLFARMAGGCHARTMKRNGLLRVGMLLASLMAASISAAAQEIGMWRAASSTARAVTGDVALSDMKIMINFASFTIAQIRALKPAEISAGFDADINAGGSGHLYRLNIPAATKFQHRNTLCGSEDTQWMATYAVGRSLEIAFFSGSQVPVFTVDAIGNSTELCGVYRYGR